MEIEILIIISFVGLSGIDMGYLLRIIYWLINLTLTMLELYSMEFLNSASVFIEKYTNLFQKGYDYWS